MQFSIVVVAKDAAGKIGRLLDSIQGLTDDIVVCDTGSQDATIEIAERMGAKVYRIPWEGYGKSKNVAITFAENDWILSLDSDEKVDAKLYKSLKEWNPSNNSTIYQILWKNFFRGKWIKHSDWGTHWMNRLFNRKIVSWDNSIAHEDIVGSEKLTYYKMEGYLEHYSFLDEEDYISKMINSAQLTAEKYHRQKRKSTYAHLVFSPIACFLKTYFIKRGFLDGSEGWLIAKTSAYYTLLKYKMLKKLNRQQETSDVVK